MAEIVTTQIMPPTQSYLSCDTQGNCCDLETNICQNINIDSGMSAQPSVNIGKTLNNYIGQAGAWVQKNPLMAMAGFLGILFISGGGGRRR